VFHKLDYIEPQKPLPTFLDLERPRVGLLQISSITTFRTYIHVDSNLQHKVFKESCTFTIRYPSDSSDLPRHRVLHCSLIIAGARLLANAVWHRSTAKLKDVLARRGHNTPTHPRQPCYLPPEILETIITHLIHNTPTLKVCAVTCFSWYNVAAPHLHRTLILRDWSTDPSRQWPNPLAFIHDLGLLPLIKQVEFARAKYWVSWVRPGIFDSRSVQRFGALVNLQDLTIGDLDFSEFPAGTGEYFGHFSPTLRSVSLIHPMGTRRQLLDFFRLFPKLDDIKILDYNPSAQAHEALDTRLIPITGGLRGQLTLRYFNEEELLKDMIVAFGGMRFTSMNLQSVRGMQLLLEACADTLETVRVHPDGAF